MIARPPACYQQHYIFLLLELEIYNPSRPVAHFDNNRILSASQVVTGCEASSKQDGGELLNFTLLLVSRRSVFRQGTRYNRRGIDSTGNVANFVETEQVTLFDDGTIASHLQVRRGISATLVL